MGDAFSEGVAFDGLHSSQEIKVLICYILRGTEMPLERQCLLELIADSGMANFFDTADAIEDLVRRGLVLCDEEERLALADGGEQIAASLCSMLPYTLRERSVGLALEAEARQRRERENRVDIVKNKAGYAVTCVIGVEQPPLMSFTVQVADLAQAELVRERFLNDPTTLYKTLFTILSDREELP